jgi:hypothetical protein
MDILSSLGLSSSTPDPTAFINQKEVTDQLTQARASVSSTLGGISFAIDAAKSLGVSPASLSSLESLQKRASALADSSTLTPAQIEAERVAVEQDLATVKAEQEGLIRQTELRDVQAAASNIVAERRLVDADSSLPAELKASIKALDESAKAAESAVQRAVSAKQAIPSDVETAASLTFSLQNLKNEREDIVNKTSTWATRFMKRGIYWTVFGFMILTLVVSALLGGSVLSNAYINESFWGIRLYYFVYGVLGFPLSLLYGAIRPPVWQSTLLPWHLEQNPNAVVGIEERSTMSKLFSYHPFSPNELGQKVGTQTRQEILVKSQSLLRWSSLSGLLASIVAVLGYVYIAQAA